MKLINNAHLRFFAKVFDAIDAPYVCRRLSITLVHPTQPAEIFGNFSMTFGTLAIR